MVLRFRVFELFADSQSVAMSTQPSKETLDKIAEMKRRVENVRLSLIHTLLGVRI